MNGSDSPGDYAELPQDFFGPGSDHCALNVGIIGAGIGGLTAAIALARSGHNVEIYEKSKFNNEIGAAINATPNAARILKYYGFDFEKAGATTVKEMQFIDGQTLDIKVHVRYSEVESRYKAPWYAMHRVDFHNTLKTIASEYPQVNINLGLAVEEVDTAGTIKLSDGQTLRKDLLIVADGVKSKFAHLVAGHPVENRSAGLLIYRFMIPTEKLLADPRSRPLYENADGRMYLAAQDSRKLVGYSCRNGALQNFGFFHEDNLPFDGEVWSIPASMDEMLEESKELHPALRAICENAEDLKQWRMIHRNQLIETLTRDNSVIIGDAAHPMLPFQGQAGAMAIEDAAALGVLFSRFTAKDQIPARLALFQKLRKDRVCAIQIFSRSQQLHYSPEEARQYVQGDLPKVPADYHEYSFRPHVINEAKAMLDGHLAASV